MCCSMKPYIFACAETTLDNLKGSTDWGRDSQWARFGFINWFVLAFQICLENICVWLYLFYINTSRITSVNNYNH